MSEHDVDHQLVEAARKGNKRAFEMLVMKYQHRLARLLSRLIRDPAELEDVTQEAFIKAYRALGNFRGDSAFYTWLYRIGVNTAKNYLVAQNRRPISAVEFENEEGESLNLGEQLADAHTPETALMNQQIIKTVNDAVGALPTELQTAITLRELEGLSYEDIAEAMNCPIGTVRSRIFRAREAIATQLRPLLGTAHNKRW